MPQQWDCVGDTSFFLICDIYIELCFALDITERYIWTLTLLNATENCYSAS